MRISVPILVVWIGVELLAALYTKRFWRMSGRDMERLVDIVDAMSPFSRNVIRGNTRALLVYFVSSLVFLAAMAVRLSFQSSNQPADWVRVVYRTLVLGSGLVALVGISSIILFNRPRWMVPPGLRKDAGLVVRWVQRLKRRNGTSV